MTSNNSPIKSPGERTAEDVPFTMHPRLLRNIIHDQAGTLSKALLEAVMNAVDAEAKSIKITTWPDGRRISIVDDGIGFGSREKILNVFAVFGFPQNAKKEFGKYHMGRGQIFSFGRTVWRSGHHKMIVDVGDVNADADPTFKLIEEPTPVEGCSIDLDLYRPLTPTDQLLLSKDLSRGCKYVRIQVIYNGKTLSSPPAEQKWDSETEDAYIRVNGTGTLRVYNLGIFVRDYPASRFGTGGDVVSKTQLQVNFARNDIKDTCPEWRAICKALTGLAGTTVKPRKAPVTEAQIQHWADQIRSGELTGFEALKAKVITACNGRHYQVDNFLRWSKASLGPAGDRPAQRAMENELAFMVSQDTLDRFDVATLPDLLDLLKRAGGQYAYRMPTAVPYEAAVAAYQGEHQILDEDELNANQLAWLNLARATYYCIWSHSTGHEDGPTQSRDLLVGHSNSSNAWTDGATYVALNDAYLGNLKWDTAGYTRLGLTLIHMFAHEQDSTQVTLPDHTYYEQVHRATEACLPTFVQACQEAALRVLEQSERRITKQIADQQTLAVKGAEAAKKFADKQRELQEGKK